MNKLIYLISLVKKIVIAPFMLTSYGLVAERLLLRRDFQCTAPQLFVMGLPRSGTTLIYQYIVHRLNVSYFTYGVGKFPYAPCMTSLIQRKIYGQYQSEFTSIYGKDSTAVAVAPREAGGFWCRFFSIDNYVEFDELLEKEIYQLRNTILCMQNIFGGVPFVNKNVKHLLRIVALSKIFPNSKFLIVERDVSDVALSIMRGRYKNLSDPMKWWSVRPPDYSELKDLSIEEQIANQVVSLKSKMEMDLSTLPVERIIRIHYEDFCKKPEHIIRQVMNALNAIETKNPPRTYFKISNPYPENQNERNVVELIREAG